MVSSSLSLSPSFSLLRFMSLVNQILSNGNIDLGLILARAQHRMASEMRKNSKMIMMKKILYFSLWMFSFYDSFQSTKFQVILLFLWLLYFATLSILVLKAASFLPLSFYDSGILLITTPNNSFFIFLLISSPPF